MEAVDLLGYAAGFLILVSLVPQIVQSVKTRRTKDISLGMYLIYVTGLFLWLIYGVLLGNTPIIVTNLIGILLSSVVLYLKFRYG
ncbi:PQ loop repeat protein [uncultured archaeon]|nr:PQ loop repeat protein [uncultured archaeon]